MTISEEQHDPETGVSEEEKLTPEAAASDGEGAITMNEGAPSSEQEEDTTDAPVDAATTTKAYQREDVGS